MKLAELANITYPAVYAVSDSVDRHRIVLSALREAYRMGARAARRRAGNNAAQPPDSGTVTAVAVAPIAKGEVVVRREREYVPGYFAADPHAPTHDAACWSVPGRECHEACPTLAAWIAAGRPTAEQHRQQNEAREYVRAYVEGRGAY